MSYRPSGMRHSLSHLPPNAGIRVNSTGSPTFLFSLISSFEYKTLLSLLAIQLQTRLPAFGKATKASPPEQSIQLFLFSVLFHARPSLLLGW